MCLETFSFSSLFGQQAKFLDFLAKVSWQGCRICSLSVHRNPLSNSLPPGEVSCVFLVWKNSNLLFWVSQRGRHKCLLRDHKNFLRQYIFILNICFVFSGPWEKKKSACRWKFPGEFVKTALPVSVKTLWRETLFWDEMLFFQSFFDFKKESCRLLARTFQLSWENCFFLCLFIFFGWNIRNVVLTFQSISHLSKNFSDYWQKQFCRIVKTSYYEATRT